MQIKYINLTAAQVSDIYPRTTGESGICNIGLQGKNH
jgi:hypothetical protein